MENRMSKIAILIALGFFAVTHRARAGSRTGNGGDGYRSASGEIYLLDLLEAGMEQNAYFDEAVIVKPEFLARVKMALPFLPDDESKLVAQKLSEIETKDLILSRSILKTIEMYSWSQVAPTLLDVKDEDTSLDIDPAKLVQVALRRNNGILISRDAWSFMSPKNRAALIFHEAIYALLKIECFERQVSIDAYGNNYISQNAYCRQESAKARQIVGYLMSPQIKSEVKRLQRIIANALPTSQGPGGWIEGDDFLTASPTMWFKYYDAGREYDDALAKFSPDEQEKIPSNIDWACNVFTGMHTPAHMFLKRVRYDFGFNWYIDKQGVKHNYVRFLYSNENYARSEELANAYSSKKECIKNFTKAAQQNWPALISGKI